MTRNIYSETYKAADYRDRLDIKKYAIRSEAVRAESFRRNGKLDSRSQRYAVHDEDEKRGLFLYVPHSSFVTSDSFCMRRVWRRDLTK